MKVFGSFFNLNNQPTKNFLVLFSLVVFSVVGHAQEKTTSMNREEARKSLDMALNGNESHNIINYKRLLLHVTTDAIALAELILFRMYGEENII